MNNTKVSKTSCPKLMIHFIYILCALTSAFLSFQVGFNCISQTISKTGNGYIICRFKCKTKRQHTWFRNHSDFEPVTSEQHSNMGPSCLIPLDI